MKYYGWGSSRITLIFTYDKRGVHLHREAEIFFLLRDEAESCDEAESMVTKQLLLLRVPKTASEAKSSTEQK